MSGRLWKYIILWENDPNVLVFMRVLAPLLTFFPELYLELEGYISTFGNLFKKACGQHVLDQMFQNFKVFQSIFFFFLILQFFSLLLILMTVGWTVWKKCEPAQRSLVEKSEPYWSTYFSWYLPVSVLEAQKHKWYVIFCVCTYAFVCFCALHMKTMFDCDIISLKLTHTSMPWSLGRMRLSQRNRNSFWILNKFLHS